MLLLMCFAMVACDGMPSAMETDAVNETDISVDNLFTVPPETESNSDADNIGSVCFGLKEGNKNGTSGRCYSYDGGEFSMTVELTVTGRMKKENYGVILILDGQPQPYKTENDDTLSYLHVFHSDTGMILEDVTFIPVTGKKGDTLELAAVYIIDPDYYQGLDMQGFKQTVGYGTAFRTVEFQADPPEAEWPAVHERVIAQNITNVDLTSLDMNGWTSEDLQENSSFTMTTDHESEYCWTYAVTPEGGLTVRAEVFGCPAVDWSFLVYVNHQPVSIQPENRIFFQTQNGKKTVMEVKVDLSDFDGEEILYAFLISRNSCAPAVFDGRNNEPRATSTYYLTDVVDVYAVYEKYGKEID